MAGLSTFKTILEHYYSPPGPDITRVWILVEDEKGKFYYDRFQFSSRVAGIKKQDTSTMTKLAQHISHSVMDSIYYFRTKNEES